MESDVQKLASTSMYGQDKIFLGKWVIIQTRLKERAQHTRVVSELAIEGNYSFHDDPISARISPPAEFFG